MKSSACKSLMRKFASLVMAIAMTSVVAFAQTKTVTGTVVDDLGEPVIGANVIVAGTSLGATTDIDGNFSITGVDEKATLQVSFIGYVTQNIPVAGKNKFSIALKEDHDELEEVVVIGYGTVKRRDLTGSVASVSGDKLKANPVSNVAQALQGQLPGVNVTSQDGRPGASMSIRVRGGGSITQSNDPLFIVDGVQVSSIDDIPADNIESMDVLKDAASTAIYGARGANGVILITTKGGKESKTTVRYGMYYQTKYLPKTLEAMDAYDYVYGQWAYMTAYGDSYGKGMEQYFGLGSQNGNHINDYRNVSAHNYVDDMMRTASSWNHDLSISGGSEKTKYYASLNYTNDEGIRILSGFKRLNYNLKLNQKINKSLTFDVDARYREVEVTGYGYEYATRAYRYRPIDNPLGDGDPRHFGNGNANIEDTSNPLYYLNTTDYTRLVKRLDAKFALTYNIVKGLVAKTEVSAGRNWSDTKTWDAGQTDKDKSSAKYNQGQGYNVRWATTLNYEIPGLGKNNNLTVLLGNEVLASKSNSSEMYGVGYPESFTMKDAFANINMTDPTLGKDYFKTTVGTPTHTLSWFGRLNYSYKGKYLLSATFRADGSSKFAPNHHWGYFPAAALGWRIIDESWMESTKDWLDNLKLRLSYGTSGNDGIDPSVWKETWVTEQITVDGQPTTTYKPGSMLGNPDLKWETTTSRNLGIDFAFLNSRIRGSVDAYWNTTDNILMKVPVNEASGYSYQFQNVGKTSNKGVEVSLGVDLVRGDNFNLQLNMTYNFNTNNVEKVSEDAMADTRAMNKWGSSMAKPAYDYIIREGRPVGTIQGFQSEGFYTVDDFTYANGIYTLKPGVPDIKEIVNYPANGPIKMAADGQTAVPGMPKFADKNGDGVVTEDDKCVIGEAMAKHTGGFTLSGNYKSLDFSASFTYQLGGKIYNANAMHSMMGDKDNGAGNNRLEFVKDAWKYYDINSAGDLELVTEPGKLAELNRNTKYASTFSEYGIVSSEFIEDASYLRLNTLTIGYTLPKKWLSKVHISNLRVYATGSNLFCISGYSGIDPDVNTNSNAGGDGFPTPNFDYLAYPKARSFTFGLNVTF